MQPPAFDDVWAAAAARHALNRRRYAWVAAAASIAAVVVVALNTVGVRPDETRFVEMNELLGSTGWVAPSDALLPQREFDIYRELPTWIESTRSEDGALL